ncbi:MAG: L-2-hydroxyglutarate oxidase [Anaerolineae bacterium]|nr:L-2-hydroxyglutarate oxidase [Anaerolineae bacterium]
MWSSGDQTYDVAVVGGGIIGLATAREFLKRHPGLRLIVLEKEDILAAHQTGHNSGVLHAGIYYAPGSLKAQACVQGRSEAIRFCDEHGIKYELCGKLIVALDDTEVPRLMNLWDRAQANGVPDVELVDGDRLREIEPFATGVKAIWSPQTGIVSWSEVARAYAADVREWGGEIRMGAPVSRFESLLTETVVYVDRPDGEQDEIRARYVVTCGGLYSDKLAAMSDPEADDEMKIVPFRGDYYTLRPEKRHLVRGMIYPVPDPEFPFLGVHFTRLINGEVWAGPNAVLAFRREGYKRWDFNFNELSETLSFPGFMKLAGKYWKTGLTEMYRDYVKSAYVSELKRYLPEIEASDLLPGPSGVRAQALRRDGTLVDDFMIQHGNRIAHVRNAPSPAATSSLVIARMIVDDVLDRADLSPSRMYSPAIAAAIGW